MIHFGFYLDDIIESKDDKHPFTNFVGVSVWHPHGSTLPHSASNGKRSLYYMCTPINPHKF
jgi:hypothetical protein